MTIKFTRITAPADICKKFWLDAGKLEKSSTAAIWTGQAEIVEAASLEDFVEQRAGLNAKQCFVYGMPVNGVASQPLKPKALAKNGEVSRTRADFRFPDGPAIFAVDVDDSGRGALECDALLCRCFPAWSRCHRVWLPSSSSFLQTSKGKELSCGGSWRAYAIIDRGSRAPSLTAFLHATLWTIGEGSIKIGMAGQRLDRSLIDTCISTPEHVDFCAAPQLGNGLKRKAPEPVFLGTAGDILSTAELPGDVQPLRDWRRENSQFRQAWDAAAPAAIAQCREAAAARGIPADAMVNAVEHGTLGPDFKIQFASGQTVTVRELLERGTDDYDGADCLDPIEPGTREVARIFLDGEPSIFSFARGGATFMLTERGAAITAHDADRHRTIRETLGLLRDRGDVFQSPDGNLLLRIARDNRQAVIAQPWLENYLDRVASWQQFVWNSKAGKCIAGSRNCPDWVARRLMALHGDWRLPTLRGVITAPTMRLDGSMLLERGHDAATGLFLTVDGAKPSGTVEAALEVLWEPLKLFPFADDTSKAVALAAMLAAVTRKTLPSCPAFVFDAPERGSGKSYLGFAIQALATGQVSALAMQENNAAEFDKQFTAELIAGSPAIFVDNVRPGAKFGGAFDSALTSEVVRVRPLGASQIFSLPAASLILISGNNWRPTNDLLRRTLICRIDAGMERPEQRGFPFVPHRIVLERRQELVQAGLTILSGFALAGFPAADGRAMASYEDFNRIIRGCVVWLGWADILDAQEAARGDNSAVSTLETFLARVHAWRGSGPWTVNELPWEMLEAAGVSDIKALGYWLRNRKDKIAGGYALRKAGERGADGVPWRIEFGSQ